MRDKAKKRGGSGEAAGRQRGGSGEAAGRQQGASCREREKGKKTMPLGLYGARYTQECARENDFHKSLS